MNNSICGADCANCSFREHCRGCSATDGCPFGKECLVAKYIRRGGMEAYLAFKQDLIEDFNHLPIPGMPEIRELYPLWGSFVNLTYTLPGGQNARFLDQDSIYLGNQVESASGGDRCLGLVGNEEFLLVCSYGENGADPRLLAFVRR